MASNSPTTQHRTLYGTPATSVRQHRNYASFNRLGLISITGQADTSLTCVPAYRRLNLPTECYLTSNHVPILTRRGIGVLQLLTRRRLTPSGAINLPQVKRMSGQPPTPGETFYHQHCRTHQGSILAIMAALTIPCLGPLSCWMSLHRL
jgi:hypothetical protein